MHIPIRIAGGPAEALVIDSFSSACGNIRGIGAFLGNVKPYECSYSEPAGFVMSWEDFERAYLEIKRLRDAFAAPARPSPTDDPYCPVCGEDPGECSHVKPAPTPTPSHGSEGK